jgi:competence transcription factor ComK
MTLVKLKEQFITLDSATRTKQEEWRCVWVNTQHIAEIRQIENTVDSHLELVTQIRFSFGTSNMTSGRTIVVAERPQHIRELAKVARHN